MRQSLLLVGLTGALGFAPVPPARALAASSCRARPVMMSSGPRVAVVTGLWKKTDSNVQLLFERAKGIKRERES